MVLHTTYFGSVSWYAQLARATGPVFIEAHENFVKQTDRTRCRIATANGVQTLSVPVNAPSRLITDVRISDHANWRHQHWNALCSAYGESPFFDYYADDIKPFFEPHWDNLFDYNLDITKKMCELLDIHPDIRLTERYEGEGNAPTKQREGEGATIAKLSEGEGAAPTQQYECREYYQVFSRRHGFIPNLSILDLLFNEGNEAVLSL